MVFLSFGGEVGRGGAVFFFFRDGVLKRRGGRGKEGRGEQKGGGVNGGRRRREREKRASIKAFVNAAPCVSGELHCSFLQLGRSNTAASQQRRDHFDAPKPAWPQQPAISIPEKEPPTGAAAIDDDNER